ncbi:type I-E CRISPR-associated protein Cas6/Cse3/CasE [Paucibacter sp. PLA-PC-4]|uniref:type I-E CRISPR-associated protein Cas6/Cse3/CasE n=1 Tax=Paucibacter sp. PLA-PC-4 TaxID=2993655 RepID=UPI00224B2EFD|nr:type I-E CRISPR-associated protein Cas6/Cse3/CasE [Paucibacter sp. PLA-PC-4]MCX2865653.1 type I-E CRISPR-associated protein Cas6/Cse3/CasE [Paucibacter sp. PLA-PC-4]
MSPMYFSLIAPAEGRVHEALQQRLAGPYADHQWLWRWFPADAGSPRDFVFRRHDGDGLPRFYAVSARQPVALGGAWQVQTREYAPALQIGDAFSFELRANPTVRHGRDGKSKRHDVVMEAKKKLLAAQGLQRWSDWTDEAKPAVQTLVQDACTDWLARRGEGLGFELQRETVLVEAHQQNRERADQSLSFTTVDIAGRLTVTDASAFIQALRSGIGSARAFGCGLLLIRRLE